MTVQQFHNIKFYCESSNAHAQTLIGAPHSESASNTLTLPSTGGDSRLVSAASTATLTNKTLTTPVIAEIDATGDFTLDAVGDITLDAGGGDITLSDDTTNFGLLNSASGNLNIKATTSNKSMVLQGLDGATAIDALTLNMADVGAASFSGVVTASNGFVGNLTGNASGTALTVTQAAQSAITSVGTLTALTVDDVAVDGKVITMTGSSGDTAVMTVAANGSLTIQTTDAAGSSGDIQITADGDVDIDSVGVIDLNSGAELVLILLLVLQSLLDGTISVECWSRYRRNECYINRFCWCIN